MLQNDFDSAMGPTPQLAQGEYILWRGKPKRSAYIADKALSMMPIAIFWTIFDVQFLGAAMGSANMGLLLFMLVHMFPVWLWLGSALTSVVQWKNEDYYLTNMRVIIRKGVFGPERQSVFLRDVHSLRVHYGLLDRLFGSGDIYINYAVHRHGKHRSTSGWFLLNLEDPQEVYDRIERAALENGGTTYPEIFD